ncbi:hypothetical protein KCV07_g333, partial [Aureobasidium melanogenum]
MLFATSAICLTAGSNVVVTGAIGSTFSLILLIVLVAENIVMEFSVRKRVAASEVLSSSSAYALAEKEGSSRAESASCGPESSGYCRIRGGRRGRGGVWMLARVCCLRCGCRGWKLVVRLRGSGLRLGRGEAMDIVNALSFCPLGIPFIVSIALMNGLNAFVLGSFFSIVEIFFFQINFSRMLCCRLLCCLLRLLALTLGLTLGFQIDIASESRLRPRSLSVKMRSLGVGSALVGVADVGVALAGVGGAVKGADEAKTSAVNGGRGTEKLGDLCPDSRGFAAAVTASEQQSENHVRSVLPLLFGFDDNGQQLVGSQTHSLAGVLSNGEQLSLLGGHFLCQTENVVVGHDIVSAIILLAGNLVAPLVNGSEDSKLLLVHEGRCTAQHLSGISRACQDVMDLVLFVVGNRKVRLLNKLVAHIVVDVEKEVPTTYKPRSLCNQVISIKAPCKTLRMVEECRRSSPCREY